MTFIPVISGFVSVNNSSIVPLISSGVFTGVSEDVSKYGALSVSLIQMLVQLKMQL